MAKRAQPEASLQRAVIEHVRIRMRPLWVIWMTPNAGVRSPRLGAQLKKMGLTAGVGDLSLVGPGGVYHELELKAGGRLSPLQTWRRAVLERVGAKWAVAHGIDDALSVLQQWGAIR